MGRYTYRSFDEIFDLTAEAYFSIFVLFRKGKLEGGGGVGGYPLKGTVFLVQFHTPDRSRSTVDDLIPKSVNIVCCAGSVEHSIKPNKHVLLIQHLDHPAFDRQHYVKGHAHRVSKQGACLP